MENQTQTTGEDSSDKKNSAPRGLRTFETDIAEYAQGKNLSLVDIAAEEAKFRGEGLRMEMGDDSAKAKLYFKKFVLIAVAILILASVAAGGYFLVKNKLLNRQQNGAIESKNTITDNGPIITDGKVEVIADEKYPGDFLKNLKKALTGSENIGILARLVIVKNDGKTKKSVQAREFFKLVGADVPAEITDYLKSDFLLLRFDDGANRPILILKTDFYEYVFSYLLRWEKQMSREFKDIFADGKEGEVGDFFKDKFIQNRDARVLYGADGKAKLAYSFINRKYLVIVGGENGLTEIFKRFSSAQFANPAAVW